MQYKYLSGSIIFGNYSILATTAFYAIVYSFPNRKSLDKFLSDRNLNLPL